MSFWLQITEPGHPARVITLDGEVEVGRDTDGLQLDDPTVSRRHLVLDVQEGVLLCIDAGSANGTWINGDRVDDPVQLAAGDVIRVGETQLVVHEARDVPTAIDEREGDGPVVIEVLDRPSEAIRDLTRATRGPRRA